MDSDSIWKKNIIFNNGTVDVSQYKKNKSKIYQKDIRGVDDMEVLEIQQRIENIHKKKKKYSKTPFFENPFASVIEGFDLVMDNSGNFQKVENDVSAGVQVLNNDYSTAMNIVAQNASVAVTTAGSTISSAGSSIGNTVSSNITYVKDSTYALGIETELSIVNMISNLIEPQDFADRELQEDLNNNRIFVVQSYSGSGSCKTISQPYKAPAGPDYNAIMNNKYAQSVLGSKTVANIPPDSAQISSIDSTSIVQPTDYSSAVILETNQAVSTVNYTVNAIYENPFVQFIIQNLRVIEYPFIYWRWLIKKIGIMWCNLIYTISSSFYKEKYSHPTDYEKRMVIANLNSIVSFLFSVLITYNWFFLMYYNFNGEKINTYTFSSESLKNFNGFLDFIFKYVAYPLECTDWFMLRFLPKWTLRIFRSHMNFVFIMTYAFFSFVTLTSVGPATIDLFYDSLKLFFNGTLKPWQPALVHTYTSFWKSFYNFGDTSSTTVKYSVTLSTYVFLHIMIFYAQIPDLIPSFFKTGGGGGGDGGGGGGGGFASELGGLSSGLGSAIKSAEQAAAGIANNAAQSAGRMTELGANAVGVGAAGVGSLASAIPSSSKENDSKHDPKHDPKNDSKHDSKHDPKQDPKQADVNKSVSPLISKDDSNNTVIKKQTTREKMKASNANIKANIKASGEYLKEKAKLSGEYLKEKTKSFGNSITNIFKPTSTQHEPAPTQNQPPPVQNQHIVRPTVRPIGHHGGGAVPIGAINAGLGAAGTAASGAIGSLANSMNPLANLSKYLPKLPGMGSLSSIGDALSSPFAGTVFGALGNIIVAIIRFCLSQYLVNIAAFSIATYLLWYSFFGIFWFSKLSLFRTMKEIDIFILKHSIDYVYETCVSDECKNRTIWERIKEIFINISRFSFPLIFYITIFFILINSCFEYTNSTSGMKSSPYIKYGMVTSSIIAIVLVAIKGYISFTHKKI